MKQTEKLQHQILQNTSLILIIASLIIAIVSLISCSNDEDAFGASIVSNLFEKGQGIITLGGDK